MRLSGFNLPLLNHNLVIGLLKELVDFWRAQGQGKWRHDIPWLFLGYRAEPICGRSQHSDLRCIC